MIIDEKLKQLQDEISKKENYLDAIRYFMDMICSNEIISSSYLNLAINLFDYTVDALEDKFKDSFIVDYKVQWLSNVYQNSDSLDEYTTIQIHLCLFFKKTRDHSPSTLSSFALSDFETMDDFYKRIKSYTEELSEKLNQNDYLGCYITYSKGI